MGYSAARSCQSCLHFCTWHLRYAYMQAAVALPPRQQQQLLDRPPHRLPIVVVAMRLLRYAQRASSFSNR